MRKYRRNRFISKIFFLVISLLLAYITKTYVLDKEDKKERLAPIQEKESENTVEEKQVEKQTEEKTPSEPSTFDYSSLPEFSGEPYTVVNDNKPYFYDDYMVPKEYTSYATYGELDQLGRCTETFAKWKVFI